MVKFLDLQAVTAKYADEIHAAVNRSILAGTYRGLKISVSSKIMHGTSERAML